MYWRPPSPVSDQNCDSKTPGTIYDYRVQVLNGEPIVDFNEFRGKPILFVNVATYWGFTYQYKGENRRRTPQDFLLLSNFGESPQSDFEFSRPSDLNALQEEWRDLGFTILGFPSNQFGKQEPGKPSEILPGLKWEKFLCFWSFSAVYEGVI